MLCRFAEAPWLNAAIWRGQTRDGVSGGEKVEKVPSISWPQGQRTCQVRSEVSMPFQEASQHSVGPLVHSYSICTHHSPSPLPPNVKTGGQGQAKDHGQEGACWIGMAGWRRYVGIEGQLERWILRWRPDMDT